MLQKSQNSEKCRKRRNRTKMQICQESQKCKIAEMVKIADNAKVEETSEMVENGTLKLLLRRKKEATRKC